MLEKFYISFKCSLNVDKKFINYNKKNTSKLHFVKWIKIGNFSKYLG